MALISPPRKIQVGIFTKSFTKNQHPIHPEQDAGLRCTLKLNPVAAIFIPATTDCSLIATPGERSKIHI
jgi:hypothetical protein